MNPNTKRLNAIHSALASHKHVEWIKARSLFMCVAGSRAYGTNTPTSDWDFRGAVVAPPQYRDGYLHRFEQLVLNDPDCTIFDVRKFFKLAADSNPNVLELLWLDDADYIEKGVGFDLLRQNRSLFLSKKVLYTFVGYSTSQLKRIRSHKKWLLDPPTHQPTREEFDLELMPVIPKNQREAAMAAVRKRIDGWEFDLKDMAAADKIDILDKFRKVLVELSIFSQHKFAAAARSIGYSENFIALLEKERKYKEAVKNWQQYNDWKKNRNKKRAGLEAQYGYDTKHGMHLVRLMRMCEEILTTGEVRVKRPDAKELLAIRNGAWSYDKLVTWAGEKETELLALSRTSALPKRPPHKKLDALCCEVTAMVDEANR